MPQSSRATRLSDGDGGAGGALGRGCAESRRRDLTEPVLVFDFLHPHGSHGWGCNLLENQCCWGVRVGDVGQCKP